MTTQASSTAIGYAEVAMADIAKRLPLWAVERPIMSARHGFPVVVARRRKSVGEAPHTGQESRFYVLPAAEGHSLTQASLTALVGEMEHGTSPAREGTTVRYYCCFVDNGGSVSFYAADAARGLSARAAQTP